MTPSSYQPASSPSPLEISPDAIANWWGANWHWALPVFGTLALIIIACTVLMYVSNWKIYKKAGKPGWAELIPFYNLYVMIEIIGRPAWMFWTYLGLTFATYIPFIGTFIGFLALPVLLVFAVLWSLDLATVFGQSTGFGVATIFFPIITHPILAFDKKIKYVGVAKDTKGDSTGAVETADSRKKTHTGLIIALAILIPVTVVIIGIIAAIIVGFVASGSKGAAQNECSIAYAKNIETAVESQKNVKKVYPTELNGISTDQLDKRMYDFCSSNVKYTSNGQTYTITATLDNYTGPETNVKNNIYTFTR